MTMTDNSSVPTSSSHCPQPEIVSHLVAERQSLTAFALKLTRDPAAAEDLVQDTCLRALTAARRYSPGTSVRAWVTSVMYRLFIDEYRRNRSERIRRERLLAESSHGDLVVASEPPPPAPWETVSLADVRRALEQLPPPQRATFELCGLQGLSYEEAAMRLGIPSRTVGTRLLRARARLRLVLSAGATVTALASRRRAVALSPSRVASAA
jgi:RNA polymerase sigma-70 factor (ECF subfamily)